MSASVSARWSMNPSTLSRFENAGRILLLLEKKGIETFPTNEGQAREIHKAASVDSKLNDAKALKLWRSMIDSKNPVTAKQVMKGENVSKVLAVMATAGLYDDSGKWLFRTGLPGKSGVGGGLIAVSPGKFGIAVISPPLDDAGNSVKAQKAIADISNALGGNPYAAKPR